MPSKLNPWTTTSYWKNRLFQNSYTHRGRMYKVKAWSVKIQYQGRRRTFTFPSLSKTGAAAEALLIYKIIVTEGWEALDSIRDGGTPPPMSDSVPGTEAFPKTDARYWKARLIDRNYPRPSGMAFNAILSARVEHHGAGTWFPLGTMDSDSGAAKALEIYLTALKYGWGIARNKFSREVTLAFHWASNPLVWTYTTFHTGLPLLPPANNQRKVRSGLRIALIEPEDGVRSALSFWLECQEGVDGLSSFSNAAEAIKAAQPYKGAFWLVNRTVADKSGTELLNQLERLDPTSCGYIYSVYEDSEQLFGTSPGGALAYLFRRTAPDRILEPLMPILPATVFTRDKIAQQVRQYFQKSMFAALPNESMRHLEKLTPREHEILQLLGKGHLDKEIADKLDISVWTVHGHVKKIFRKLEVHSRTEAVVTYLQK